MALENTTTISGLVSSNPPSGDPVSQSDDHIRLIKQVLLSTFPSITGPITRTQADINAVPSNGMVMLFYGQRSQIPTGWAPCDGGTYTTPTGVSQTTPNLMDRMVAGAGNRFAAGSTYGNPLVAAQTYATTGVGDHTHAGSADSQGNHNHGGAVLATALSPQQLAPHSHLTVTNLYQTAAIYARGTDLAAANFTGGDAGYQVVSYNTGLGQTHTHGVNQDGTHSHNITVGPGGGHGHTVTFDPTPAFTALWFIMKL